MTKRLLLGIFVRIAILGIFLSGVAHYEGVARLILSMLAAMQVANIAHTVQEIKK